MWGKYGDSGKGIAIGYDIIDIYEHLDRRILDNRCSTSNGLDWCYAHAVEYVSDYCTTILDNYKSLLLSETNLQPTLHNAIKKICYTKDASWSHEKEFRIVFLKNYNETINNSEFIQDPNKYIESMVTNHENCHEKFLLPSYIILGWDVDQEYTTEINRRIKGLNIKVHQLDRSLDYIGDGFSVI